MKGSIQNTPGTLNALQGWGIQRGRRAGSISRRCSTGQLVAIEREEEEKEEEAAQEKKLQRTLTAILICSLCMEVVPLLTSKRETTFLRFLSTG